MNLVDELHLIVAALEAAGLRYAVCGGVAVTVHGVVRSTRDIDLLVSTEALPAVLAVVGSLGYSFVSLPMTFDEGTERERHVQRATKVSGGEHMLLDLLLEQGALQGALDDAIEVRLPQGSLRVVSLSTLCKMKRLAGRAQDLADLERLEADDDE